MSKKLYVAKTGSDFAKGSEDEPLLTINKAASLALPGDTVIVHEGVYREEINDTCVFRAEDRRHFRVRNIYVVDGYITHLAICQFLDLFHNGNRLGGVCREYIVAET